MAEQGLMRTSLAGFNKADVLSYVDNLRTIYTDELVKKDSVIANLEKTLSEKEFEIQRLVSAYKALQNNQDDSPKEEIATEDSGAEPIVDAVAVPVFSDAEKINAWQQQIDFLKGEIEKYKTTIAQLTAEKKQLKIENKNMKQILQASRRDFADKSAEKSAPVERIRTQPADANSATLEEYRVKLHECQKRLAEAELELQNNARNSKNHAMVMADIGSFMVELHGVGNDIVASSQKQSSECLDALGDTVKKLGESIARADSDLSSIKSNMRKQEKASKQKIDEIISQFGSAAKNGAKKDKTV